MAMNSKKLTLDVNRIKADGVVRNMDRALRAGGLTGYSLTHDAGTGRRATRFSVICDVEADLRACENYRAALEDIAQAPVEFVHRNAADVAGQPPWSDERNVVAPREDDIVVDDGDQL